MSRQPAALTAQREVAAPRADHSFFTDSGRLPIVSKQSGGDDCGTMTRDKLGTWLVAGAVAALCQGVCAQAPETASPASPTAREAEATPLPSGLQGIAVVDTERALRSYPKGRKLLDEMMGAKAAAEAALKTENAAVEKLKIERDGYERMTAEWVAANSRWEAGQAGLESRFKGESERFEREKDKIQAACCKDLDEAIAELARKKGLLLVLRLWPVSGADSMTKMLARNSFGDLLYADPRLDLTEDVIRFLQTWTSPAEAASTAKPDK